MSNFIRFTPAQAAAISARGGSLLVSAAAGSGKTRVLVERTVGLITDPHHPIEADRLLIMTFTNAAAAKLRADITARLLEEVRAHPADQRLRRQQLRLQRASIGTVDAFCLHFVQQHFASLDIPPDFQTADDATLSRLRQESLAAVLEQAYTDPDFRAFADLYDRGRTDDTAGTVIVELYDFTRSLPHPDQALDAFAAAWQSDCPPQDTRWGQAVLEQALARAEGILRLLDAAVNTAVRDKAADRAYTAVLLDDQSRVQELQQLLQARAWDKAVEAAQALRSWRRAGRVQGGKDSNTAALAASELRDRAKKQAAKLSSDFLVCTAAEFAADRRRAAPLVAALVRAVKLFGQTFLAAKLEEKILDYADYEHMTLDLLQTPDGSRTPLCETVSRRYEAVLVDEYQDTNALQDAIYFSLAAPDAANLFFVGDIKQSIYRFRQADPSVFAAKQSAWQPYPDPPQIPLSRPATIALDANFRSAPAVIEGINYLFECIFSDRLGGIGYGPGQKLVVGKPDAYEGLCELCVVEQADAAGDAAAIAARIQAMVDEGFPVRCPEGQRPCRFEDFCILLRGRSDFPIYEAALRAAGVPVYADVAADLLDAPHVRPFAALLSILDNPAQDVDLAAVLLSPLYPYTPDDLVRLRSRVRGGSLYAAVLHGGQGRFDAFLRDLTAFRRLARTLPVDALIEELFARTGYLAAVGAMPDGARCREDLRTFASWAAGAGARGLPALVRAMEAARQAGGLQPGGSGQTRPGCVSIMTVHRSKGLEFPVVFVANTTHKFNQSDAIRPVLCHRSLGVGLMLRDPGKASRYRTLPHAALARTIRTETLSEEMRILYVALTRAQDALIVTVPVKRLEQEVKLPALYAYAGAIDAETLQGFSSWGSWLLTAALCHPDSGPLWSQSGFLPRWKDTRAPLGIRVVTAPPPGQAQPAGQPVPADPALRDALLQNFAWRYPRQALRDVPAKVSVTAVTHGTRPTRLERPAFLQKSGLTGAERGTAIHAFLQNVPLQGPAPDLDAEVRRQTERKLLDPTLASQLRLEEVRPFFESAVWRRLHLARQVLREEPFITALPAGEIAPAARPEGAPPTGAQVLVQGIADVVLIFDDHAEILDYKTDRARDPEFYRREYAGQLQLYRRAFALRLQVPVTKLTIYSTTLAQEIDIPLQSE